MKNDAFLEDGFGNTDVNNKNDHRKIMTGLGTKQGSDQRSAVAISLSSECTDYESVFIGDSASEAPLSPKDAPPKARPAVDNNGKILQQQQAKQLLVPPPPSTRLQVPSQGPPSIPSISRPSSVLSNVKSSVVSSPRAPSNEQEPPSPKQAPQSAAAVLPLGLREVMNNYHKEYIGGLLHIVKLNLGVLIVGSILVFTGLAMMIYSAIKVLSNSDAFHEDTADSDSVPMGMLESIFEKLGAVLAGIGAFVDMISVVYILDNRAILERERVEKIDTYKRNRQQPRNLFEILLANAKQKAAAVSAAAAASANSDVGEEPNKTGVGVVITEDPSTANNVEATVEAADNTSSTAVPPAKPGETKMESLAPTPWRRPSASSSHRQRLGSNAASMAKQMAAVTSEQLKQFSKAKGENVEVFVVSHHKGNESRPGSRASVSSSLRHRTGQQLDNSENALQVHRALEDWLKSSVVHTTKNEFATEVEPDAASETMSVSIASGRDSANGSPPSSRSITPEPTMQNIANPDALVTLPSNDDNRARKYHSHHKRSGIRLKSSNVAIRNVFRQMVASQKTGVHVIYEGADRGETPLPPPVRVSAHYARRAMPPQQGSLYGETTPRTLNPLDTTRLTGVVVSKPNDLTPRDTHLPPHNSEASAVWATNTSEKIRQNKAIDPFSIRSDDKQSSLLVRRGTTLMITEASPDSHQLPPLPPQSRAGNYSSAGVNSNANGKPPLPRFNTSTNMGASSNSNNNTEKIGQLVVKK